MALEMQDLSSSSSSDIDRLDQSDFEVGDTEIARALGQEVEHVRAPGRSRVHTAFRALGVLMLVVGVIAALGFIFLGERERDIEQKELYDELKQVEIFVQYMPEEELLPFEEVDGATLKTTDPPPM